MLQASKYLYLVKKYFPSSQWTTALAVIMGESHGDPNISNLAKSENHTWWANRYSALRSGPPPKDEFLWGSFGLFQIGAYNADSFRKVNGKLITKIEELKDPETNIAIASILAANSKGWENWGAFTNGAYKDFLNQAKIDIRSDLDNTYNEPKKVKQVIRQEVPRQPVIEHVVTGNIETPPEKPVVRTRTKMPKYVVDRFGQVTEYGVDWLSKRESVVKFLDQGQRMVKFLAIGAPIHHFLVNSISQLEGRYQVLADFHSSLLTIVGAIEFILIPALLGYLQAKLYAYVKTNPNASPVLKFVASFFSFKHAQKFKDDKKDLMDSDIKSEVRQ